LKNQ